jgi:hypothetical protein
MAVLLERGQGQLGLLGPKAQHVRDYSYKQLSFLTCRYTKSRDYCEF